MGHSAEPQCNVTLALNYPPNNFRGLNQKLFEGSELNPNSISISISISGRIRIRTRISISISISINISISIRIRLEYYSQYCMNKIFGVSISNNRIFSSSIQKPQKLNVLRPGFISAPPGRLGIKEGTETFPQ